MAFWTDVTDPKRKYNFQISIGGAGNIKNYYAKTAEKPTFTLSSVEHNYLNHTYYYPGRVTWNPVSISFVDPGTGDDSASQAFAEMLKAMGYSALNDENDAASISKSKAVAATGIITIEQIDGEGNSLDKWELRNAFITEVNFGDLDYSSDDMVELSVTFQYDYATFSEGSANELFGINDAPIGIS